MVGARRRTKQMKSERMCEHAKRRKEANSMADSFQQSSQSMEVSSVAGMSPIGASPAVAVEPGNAVVQTAAASAGSEAPCVIMNGIRN